MHLLTNGVGSVVGVCATNSFGPLWLCLICDRRVRHQLPHLRRGELHHLFLLLVERDGLLHYGCFTSHRFRIGFGWVPSLQMLLRLIDVVGGSHLGVDAG